MVKLENHHPSTTMVIMVSGNNHQWMLTPEGEYDVHKVPKLVLTRHWREGHPGKHHLTKGSQAHTDSNGKNQYLVPPTTMYWAGSVLRWSCQRWVTWIELWRKLRPTHTEGHCIKQLASVLQNAKVTKDKDRPRKGSEWGRLNRQDA